MTKKRVGNPVVRCVRGNCKLIVGVHDAQQRPVRGVEITLRTTGQKGVSSARPVSFDGLPPGRHTVEVTGDLTALGLRLTGGSSGTSVETVTPDVIAVTWFVVEALPRPRIDVQPGTKDFGVARIGAEAGRQVFTVTNVGQAPLTVVSATIGGGGLGPAPFAITQPLDTSTPFAIGASRTLEVSGTPQDVQAALGALAIDSDAENAPHWSGSLRTAPFGFDALRAPTHLAPHTERIRIELDVTDPRDVGTLRMEVRDRRGGGAILRRDVTAEEKAAGFLEWDGRIDAHVDYPDQYVTVVHSPYTVRMIATWPGGPDQREVVVAVEAVELSLSLGPKEVIRDATIHRTLHDQLTARDPPLPPVGHTKQVPLRSNIFKAAIPEREHDNATSYDQLAAMWGEGPLLPIYAEVKLRSSTGAVVLAPKGLGGAKILWDYEDVSGRTDDLEPRTLPYVNEALAVEVDTTTPPGKAAHQIRGGARGTGNPLFPASATYGGDVEAFPFTVTRAGTRTWASYSALLSDGPDASKSGVIFRPPRIAGDAYRVTAHLELHTSLDVAGPVASSLSRSTGTLEIWREVHVAKIMRKNDQVEEFDFDALLPRYAKAFIRLVNVPGRHDAMDEGDYDTKFGAALLTRDSVLKTHGIADPDHQYAAGNAALTFRSVAEFEDHYLLAKTAQMSAITERYKQERLVTHALDGEPAATLHAQQRTRALARDELVLAGLLDPDPSVARTKYANLCDSFAGNTAIEVCNAMRGDIAVDGVVIFMFANAASTTPDGDSTTNGVALNGTNATRHRAGYIQYAPKASYVLPASIEATMAHEIGHCMFLPHTASEDEAKDPLAHDAGDPGCLMSYNFKVQREFCGYCNLRLRGWDHTKLSDQAANNAVRPRIDPTRRTGAFVADVGATSAPQTIEITNRGTGSLVVRRARLEGADAAHFEIRDDHITGARVASAGTATLAIVFRPTEIGHKTARLVIESNDPGSPTVLVVDSNGRSPGVTLGAGSHDFDVAALPARQDLTLRSSGAIPVRIVRFELAGAHAADFRVEEAIAGTSVPVGDTKTFTVHFDPQANGDKTATLRVHSDAPDSPHAITLAGKRASRIEVTTPDGTSMGTLDVGTLSAEKRVVVRNTGNGPLTITGIECKDFALTGEIDPCELAPGASRTIRATLTPGYANFFFSGFYVKSNAASGTDHVYLSGTGRGDTGTLTITPTVKDFGSAPLPAEQVFTLTNTDANDVRVASISVTAKGYAVEAPVVPFTLRQSETRAIKVKFLPSGANGAFAAKLRIESNASNSTLEADLTGTLDAALVIETPHGNDFGTVAEAESSAGIVLRLRNSGNAPVTVNTLREASGNYVMSGIVLPLTLRATETKDFTVTLTPRERGFIYKVVEIATDPAVTVANCWLSGRGTGPRCTIRYTPPEAGSFRAQVGATVTKKLRIHNDGPGAMDITALHFRPGDFTLVNPPGLPHTLASAGVLELDVELRPSKTGLLSATLDVTSTATSGPGYCFVMGYGDA